MTNFENLKAGDKVAIYGRGTLERRTVDRVTAAMFTVADDARKFSRKTGREHGSSSLAPSWAEPWTDDHARDLAERKAEQESREMRRRLIDFPWRSLSGDQVKAAIAALEAAGVLPVA